MSLDARAGALAIEVAVVLAVTAAPVHADPFGEWDNCVRRSFASQRIADAALQVERAFISCLTDEKAVRADALALVPRATTEDADWAVLAIKQVVKQQLLEQSASAASRQRQSTEPSPGVLEWCSIAADGLSNPWQFLLEAMKQGCLR